VTYKIPLKVTYKKKSYEYDRMSGTNEPIYVRRSKEGERLHVILVNDQRA
jgi:hypothetical protein